MDKNLIKHKTLASLNCNDIVIHPIYRQDGLLFVKQFKKLTNSILNHLRNHFPKEFPFLVVEFEKDVELLFSNEEIINLCKDKLNELVTDQQPFINVPLSLELLLDSRFLQNEAPKIQEIFLGEFHPQILSPLWEVMDKTIESPRVLKRAKEINEKFKNLIFSDRKLVKIYKELAEYHDVLLIHSLNTTCISYMIGLTLELEEENLINLLIAALFADIGFIRVPREEFIDYLDNGKSDSELIKKHLKMSVEIISVSDLARNRSVIYGILDHHEEFQGSGFPNQKKAEEIHIFGRIIAIAQKYDELVGGYIKEKNILSIEALQQMWDEGDITLDRNIFRVFYDKTRLYKVGEIINLTHNEKGTIIGFNDYLHKPFHPIIRLENGTKKDLSENG